MRAGGCANTLAGTGAAGNFDASFEHLALPSAILGAVVAHAGELTPAKRYLEEPLDEHAPSAERAEALRR